MPRRTERARCLCNGQRRPIRCLHGSTSRHPIRLGAGDVVAQGVGVGGQHRLRLRHRRRRCPVRAADGALRQVPRRPDSSQRRRSVGEGQAGVLRRPGRVRLVRREGAPAGRVLRHPHVPPLVGRGRAGVAEPDRRRGRRTRLIEWLDASGWIGRAAGVGSHRRHRRSTSRRAPADGAPRTPSNGETLVLNGYPIQPKTSINVTSTVAGYTARGATLETMQTSLVPGVVPQMARATADRGSSERAVQPATVVFPTAFQAVSGTTQNQRLVVFPGQFSDLDPTPGANAGTQLLDGSRLVHRLLRRFAPLLATRRSRSSRRARRRSASSVRHLGSCCSG